MPLTRRYTHKTRKARSIKSDLIKTPSRNRVDRRQDKQIVRIDRRLKNVQRGLECKYNLLPNNLFANILTTPQTLFVNNLARGTTTQTRIGDYVSAKRLNIKGILSCGMAGVPYQASVRMMIIQWKRQNYNAALNLYAASPAEGYLFSVAAATPYINQMYNFNNMDFKNTFKVLYDKVHILEQPQQNIPVTRMIRLSIKLNSTKVSYKGGTANNATDVDTNGYWIVAWTDNTTNGVNFRFDSCWYFMDQ